jgi:glutathione-independent formaldehyde dehydrogenase
MPSSKQLCEDYQQPRYQSRGLHMKALVYHGPRKVSVDNVPDAKIEKMTDVVIKLTTTNICGSDLHMYEGRTDMKKGRILGHENLGEVVEVGKAVDTVKKGDKVVLPFNVGCGFCANCERGLTGYCITCADPSVMPGMAGAAYGFADMGPYEGGQAQYRCLLRNGFAKTINNRVINREDCT